MFSIKRNGDFDRMYSEIKNLLKTMRIKNAEHIRDMFLKFDADRTGTINKANLKDLFRAVNLPVDDDLLDTVISCTVMRN